MSTRLDNIINNSHSLKGKLLNAKTKARQQAAWAKGHFFVSRETGEILTKKDGERLAVADVSRSWYLKSGGRNNARIVVERLKKSLLHPSDVARFRPKFVTLTFRNTVTSWVAERAVQKFLNAVRTWAKREGIDALAYFWTAEVQMKNQRGALHYHIVFLGLPFVPKWQWRKWWRFGWIDARAVDDLGRVFKYLAKYLWKWGKMAEDADELPDWWYYFSRDMFSKRRYGFSNWYRLPIVRRIPGWLRDALQSKGQLERCSHAARAVGGGWDLQFEGTEEGGDLLVHFRSPFQIAGGRT